MKYSSISLLFSLAILLPSGSRAQLPSAELYSITPPVIRAGETTEVTIAGLNLEDLTSLVISDPAIQTEAIPGTKKFRVTAAPEHPGGRTEVRADGYFGRSTSRFLTVVAGDVSVIADTGSVQHEVATAPPLPLEAVACGTADANRIDHWKITLTKGQRILVHCHAERIDSRADASLVLYDRDGHELERNHNAIGRDPMLDFTAPADGDYFIGVFDFLYKGGTEYFYLLTASERPWIDSVYPPAGQEGQVMEATLFGRNLPGGSPGEGLQIDGKPIETLSVRIPVKEAVGPIPDPAGPARSILPGFVYQFENSNPVRIGIAGEPVVTGLNEVELPALTTPCEVAARFDQDGDSDSYRFSTRPGTAYWIEVTGDRIDGRVDPSLVLEKVTKGADGKESYALIREGDDSASQAGTRFQSGSRDATLSLPAGEAGDYRVTVVNQFRSGGPTHLYRLAIREARPDFDLFAVMERSHYELQQAHPAVPLLRKGGTEPVRVLIRRKDGFDGPITLEAQGLPAGVSCPPVTASLKEDSVRLVFQASPEAEGWNGDVVITGRGKTGEAEMVRPARAGAFVRGAADATKEPLRSRLSVALPLSVSKTEKAPVSFEIGNNGRFSVEMGKKLEIPVKVTARNGVKGALVITADGLQGLRQSPSLTLAEGTNEGKLVLNFVVQNNIFTPGEGTWTFVLKATGTTSYRYRPEVAEAAAAELKAADEALKAAKPGEKDSLTKAKAAIEAKVKAATTASAAKDIKFSAYSLPVVVEVKPAPKKNS